MQSEFIFVKLFIVSIHFDTQEEYNQNSLSVQSEFALASTRCTIRIHSHSYKVYSQNSLSLSQGVQSKFILAPTGCTVRIHSRCHGVYNEDYQCLQRIMACFTSIFELLASFNSTTSFYATSKKSNDVFMNGRIVVLVTLATGDNNVSICGFHFNVNFPLCLNFTTQCENS